MRFEALHKRQTYKKAGERVFQIKIKINRQIQKANMTNKKINKQSELFKRPERCFGTVWRGCEEMEMSVVGILVDFCECEFDV